MNFADDIKKYIENAGLSINPDIHEEVFRDVLHAHEQTTRNQTAYSQMSNWSLIMRSKIVKLATAVIVITAIIMGIDILHNTGGTAWAIEHSIKAVSKYRAVLIEGSESHLNEDGDLEMMPLRVWAVANKKQTKVVKERIELDGISILSTNGMRTWRYDPKTNTVRTGNDIYVPSECWLGSGFLQQLKSAHDNGIVTKWKLTYGKDPATEKQRAFLTIAWLEERYNGPRSFWIEFDMESKLPVGFRQWENADCDGPATLIGDTITYYENLPDDLFEFEIPEGAIVIEQ